MNDPELNRREQERALNALFAAIDELELRRTEPLGDGGPFTDWITQLSRAAAKVVSALKAYRAAKV